MSGGRASGIALTVVAALASWGCGKGGAGADGASGGASFKTIGKGTVTRFASDANNFYWLAGNQATQASKSGGAPVDLGESGVGLAVDNAFVYVAGPASLVRVPIGGGPPQTISNPGQVDIAVDDMFIFAGYGGELHRIPKAGGAEINSGAVAVQGGGRIILDGANAYWLATMSILTMEKTGWNMCITATGCTAPTSVVSDADDMGQGGFALDADNFYWTDVVASAIKKAPRAGGAVTVVADRTTAPDAVTYPVSVAVDTTYLYWINGDATTVWKAPLAGGAPIVVANDPGVGRGSELLVDDTSIIWGGGSVGNIDVIVK